MINLFRIINFSFVVAGRIKPYDEIGADENPKFGFYWWFWMPEINTNGAKLLNPDQCYDISLLFLCFSFGFILWPIKNHHKNSFVRRMYK